ncbi:unnamed protein product [Acanthoscelides obtectus]|uniref:Vacuolar protein sorting-associated protein VTA1 homolog n=1 Tax=Acanthoscelides obtectus TaxID=200917 RepID=A0A9P0KTF0_ACAOB|nr:unnamed protein product [Acanthoscelides obtectus]CAK1681897.1 Vacuolar protein sorting-associated protein VTA1 homolog [Acanthoscelides obtectus]
MWHSIYPLWIARMAACSLALRVVPGKKSPETANLIRAILAWLEVTKEEHRENDGITNTTVAQAIIENYALKLFENGDEQDKADIFNKNTVKTFYTAGILMDVLEQFGELSEDIREKRKYAKWKAAYIHNCLKRGEQPLSGPPRPPYINTGSLKRKPMQMNYNIESEEPPDDQIRNDSETSTVTPITPDEKPSSPPNFEQLPPPGAQEGAPAPQPSPVSPGPLLPSAVPVYPGATGSDGTAGQAGSNGTTGGYQPTPEVIQKAQKFCKYATSALNYDDVKNALENIEKARNLLLNGNE